MKYGYTVKYNGEYYPAGTEVPDEIEKKADAVEKASALLDEDEVVVPKKKPGRPKKEQ